MDIQQAITRQIVAAMEAEKTNGAAFAVGRRAFGHALQLQDQTAIFRRQRLAVMDSGTTGGL